MKKLYFETEKKPHHWCITPCPINPTVYGKIGSVTCQECSDNKGFNLKKQWVKCGAVAKTVLNFMGEEYELTL